MPTADTLELDPALITMQKLAHELERRLAGGLPLCLVLLLLTPHLKADWLNVSLGDQRPSLVN